MRHGTHICRCYRRTCRRNTLQHTATHCNSLQHTATHCNTLQHTSHICRCYRGTCRRARACITKLVATSRPSLSHRLLPSAAHVVSHMLQRTATHCNALQCTATHCNALQRTATNITAKSAMQICVCWYSEASRIHCGVYVGTVKHVGYTVECVFIQ